MRRVRLFLLTIFISLVVCLSVVLWRPAIILHGILRSSLAEQGYTLTDLGLVSVGRDTAEISALAFHDSDWQFEALGLGFTFSALDLLQGGAANIEIDSLKVIEFGANQDSDELVPESEEVFSSIAAIEQLPFEKFLVHELSYVGEAVSAQLTMTANGNPFSARIETSANSDDLWRIRASVEKIDEINISSRLMISYLESPALSALINASDLGSTLLLTVDSELSLQSLLKHPALAVPLAGITALDDQLEILSTVTMADDYSALLVSSFEVTLNSPDSIFRVQQESEGGRIVSQVHMPITFSGAIDSQREFLNAESKVIYSTGDWSDAAGDFEYQATLESVRLDCERILAGPLDCQANSLLQTSLPHWSTKNGGEAGVNGMDLSLEGPVSISYASGQIGLSSPELLLEIPSISNTYGVASIGVEISQFDAIVSENNRVDFRFESNSLNPGITGYQFENPTFSGLLRADSESLNGVIELTLAEQLKLGAGFQHDFSRDTGSIEVQLAPLQFELEAPLSRLISQRFFSFDLEGGSVSGRVNVSWSLDQNKTWRVGGPVVVDINNLSGYVDNTLFIDFNSRMLAEVTTPIGLLSSKGLSASLVSIDPGMPLDKLSWEYGFDTAKQEFSLGNFAASLLGGVVEIPSFTYKQQENQQQLNVVLSNLEMTQIVDLADYPNLAIDGRVSGYLPILLSGDTITLENGLMSALSPGGTIRYTPATSAPSSNSSVQLVNDALSNYQYQLLDAGVNYDENGDLQMAVQLQGKNPDMNNGQAINLNVNISDNLPTLFKSLQAGRSISEELERQLRLRQEQ